MKSFVGELIKSTTFRVVFELAIPHVSIELGEPIAKFAEIWAWQVNYSIFNI